MIEIPSLPELRRSARIAGLWYLLLAVTGGFGQAVIRGSLVVLGDTTKTIENLLAHETLFRFAAVSDLACQVLQVFLGLALYHLFRDVDRRQARLLLFLVAVMIPVAFLNVLNEWAALIILGGGGNGAGFSTEQIHALAMMFLQFNSQGIVIVGIFWGLWLLPFGILILKSDFIPKVFGVALMVGCASYLADSLTWLILPSFGKTVSNIAMIGMLIGEIPVLLWLLIVGAARKKPLKIG